MHLILIMTIGFSYCTPCVASHPPYRTQVEAEYVDYINKRSHRRRLVKAGMYDHNPSNGDEPAPPIPPNGQPIELEKPSLRGQLWKTSAVWDKKNAALRDQGKHPLPMFDWKQMICLADRFGIKYNIESCHHINEGDGQVILKVREGAGGAAHKDFVINKPGSVPGHSLKKRNNKKTPGFREYKFRYHENITIYNKKDVQHKRGPFHLMPTECNKGRCGRNPGHTQYYHLKILDDFIKLLMEKTGIKIDKK